MSGDEREFDLEELRPCCEGVVPPVLATADSLGVPNVTYLSCAHIVDGERIALSNQFFSKTARNVMENPRASLLLIDPRDYGQYRVALEYERTDRHGPAFEALRRDVDTVAALQGMQDVFRLRAADVYRVVRIEQVRAGVVEARDTFRGTAVGGPAEIAELSMRLGRAPDLDTLVATALRSLADLLGFEHSILVLVDETGSRLYTIASHGYAAEGVGSEVAVGEGTIGVVADQCRAVRVANLTQARKYARAVRQSFEAEGRVGPGVEIPMPGLELAETQLAVPAMAMGRLVGVLMVESERNLAFDSEDEAVLTVVAGMLASAIEIDLVRERTEPAAGAAPVRPSRKQRGAVPVAQVRFFAVDGSVFLGTDYLIKGVAGRILWSLLNQYTAEGREEFTNREVRLDPTLDLPEYRDNLESRLILLKRRLEERDAPIRIEKTGRGRFRLVVDAPLQLDAV